MNEKKLIIFVVIFSLVLLFGGVFVLSSTSSTPQITASANVKAAINKDTIDFGEVKYNGDIVSREYSIKNTGTDTLKLANIKTSCHCTKAYVTINGSASPSFGMSGISSWLGEIAPGKEAKVTVNFDPKFHGISGVGPTVRYISIETNDRTKPKLTLTLNGLVTK